MPFSELIADCTVKPYVERSQTMTDQERFSEFPENDTTFWGRLFRDSKVKTFGDARAVAEKFCQEARAEGVRNDQG